MSMENWTCSSSKLPKIEICCQTSICEMLKFAQNCNSDELKTENIGILAFLIFEAMILLNVEISYLLTIWLPSSAALHKITHFGYFLGLWPFKTFTKGFTIPEYILSRRFFVVGNSSQLCHYRWHFGANFEKFFLIFPNFFHVVSLVESLCLLRGHFPNILSRRFSS